MRYTLTIPEKWDDILKKHALDQSQPSSVVDIVRNAIECVYEPDNNDLMLVANKWKEIFLNSKTGMVTKTKITNNSGNQEEFYLIAETDGFRFVPNQLPQKIVPCYMKSLFTFFDKQSNKIDDATNEEFSLFTTACYESLAGIIHPSNCNLYLIRKYQANIEFPENGILNKHNIFEVPKQLATWLFNNGKQW